MKKFVLSIFLTFCMPCSPMNLHEQAEHVLQGLDDFHSHIPLETFLTFAHTGFVAHHGVNVLHYNSSLVHDIIKRFGGALCLKWGMFILPILYNPVVFNEEESRARDAHGTQILNDLAAYLWKVRDARVEFGYDEVLIMLASQPERVLQAYEPFMKIWLKQFNGLKYFETAFASLVLAYSNGRMAYFPNVSSAMIKASVYNTVAWLMTHYEAGIDLSDVKNAEDLKRVADQHVRAITPTLARLRGFLAAVIAFQQDLDKKDGLEKIQSLLPTILEGGHAVNIHPTKKRLGDALMQRYAYELGIVMPPASNQ